MEKMGISDEDKKLKITVFRTLIVMFLFYIATQAVVSKIGVRNLDEYKVDSFITSDVTHNGITHGYASNYFIPPQQGDEIVLKINQSKLSNNIENPDVVFSAYSCDVSVYFGNERIYKQDMSKFRRGAEIGQILYTVPLPKNYKDKTVVIKMTALNRRTFSSVSDVYVLPAEYARFTPINDVELQFIVFLCTLAVSAAAAVFMLIEGIAAHHIKPVFYMVLFCFLFSFWYVAKKCYLYILTQNLHVAGLSEYYALYFMMIPLCIYMRYQFISKTIRKICNILAAIFGVYSLTVVFLNQYVNGLTFTDFLVPLHILMAVAAIFFSVNLYFERKRNTRFDVFVLRNGMMISIAFCMFELLRWNVGVHLGYRIKWLSEGVGFYGLLAMLLTLFISFCIRMISDSRDLLKQQELKKIAYTDSLTEIPNRMGCYSWLERFRSDDVKQYSIFFFDANNLKCANDNYGHEVGDRLIRKIASSIAKAFDDEGFYGRWGGDEFIAGSLKTKDEVDLYIKKFNSEIDAVNETNSFPFEVSASYGRVDVTKECFIDPFSAVNIADSQMYEVKKEYKKCHKILLKKIMKKFMRKFAENDIK